MQTLDQYGNVTQMQVYDYGNLSTPARTYTNTYLSTPAYTSLYIFNRLLTSTVTDGTHSTTLATNTYDCCNLNDAPSIQNHYSPYNTTYLTRGNVTTAVTPAGTTTRNFDIAGNVTLTNNNNLSTSATINSSTNYAAPTAITTNSLSSNLTYSSFMGLSSVTNQPNGDSGSIGYDTSARPQRIASPLGAVTTFTYNDSASPPTKVATTNGHWVRTTMDGLGRTIKTETGNGTTTVSVVDTQYISCGCSPLGKMGQQSAPHDPNGAVYWTTYNYDGLGRTTQVWAPDGSITHYSYAGNTVTVTDPAGKTKTFTMDAFGNLTIVQEPDPALGTVSTSYTYDMLNHLILVTMPRGSNTQTRTFNYNVGSTVGIDLLSATNPENGTVTYTYNSDHTLHTKTDAKSQVFTYSYDSYKRLTQIQVGSTVLRTFMYDTNTLDSGYSGAFTAGRLVAVQHTAFTPQGYIPGNGGSNITVPSSMQFTEMYNYTQPGLTAGKRLQVEETLHYYVNGIAHDSPHTLNLDGAYTYDNEGKMTSVNYPKTWSWNGSQLISAVGPTYTYSFDAMDRPTGLKDQNNATAVSNVSYNPANQLLGITYFGTVETRQYNNMNQMTSLAVGSDTITYTFPAGTNNGKISQQSDSVSGETVTYQYDSLNRLLSASSNQGWSETYGFDGFGNLLSKTPTGGAPTLSQAVDATTNRVVGQTYDANGNQTTGGYTYDAENRLATSTGLQYGYDSRNKRIWKATLSGGNLTQEVYFYGVDGQKLGTYVFNLQLSNGTPVMTDDSPTLAVFFGGKRIKLGNSTFTQDRLGSNQGFKFYPYGEARGTPPADTVGFATYTHDSATGLDYADQRYYANNFGRFMSPDPYVASGGTSDPGSWNRYAYVGADPVNYVDPRGRQKLRSKVEWEPYEGEYMGTLVDCISGSDENGSYEFCSIEDQYSGSSGAGGGGRPAVQVGPHIRIGPRNTAAQVRQLKTAISKVLDHIGNFTCADFLLGPGASEAAPVEVAEFLGDTTYSILPFPGSMSTEGAHDVSPTYVQINANGAFYTAGQNPNGTVSANLPNSHGDLITVTFGNVATLDAFILLHELGHQLGVYGDDTSLAVNGANSAAVLNNCFTKNAQGVYY